jgi:hypothetical protein
MFGEGPGGYSFSNESVFIFTLSSPGPGEKVKITAIHDFVDTKQAADTAAAAAAAAAQR